MALSPKTRTWIWATGAVIAAAVCGSKIADGDFALPALIATAAAMIVALRYGKLPVSTVLLAGIIAGNIVGNRGFAQLFIAPSLPILPAELVLISVGAILLFRAAVSHQTLVRKTPLNIAILIWIAISAVRLPVDFQSYKVLAIRDFVTVGYSLYFFLAQDICLSEANRRIVTKCMEVSFIALLIIFPIYTLFPSFFLEVLVLRDNPLIFYKGDLAGTFLGIGSVLFFYHYDVTRKPGWLALALLSAAVDFYSHNRASALALFAGVILLALGKRTRPLAWLTGCAVLGAAALVIAATFQGKSWDQTPIYGLYEEAISVTDPSGQHNYSGEDTSMKGDNNAFRMIWWRMTISEAWRDAPLTGLGWGYDLSSEFERIYYPEGSDEFSVRSPHNVFITIFARGGLVSLGGFLLVLAAAGVSTLRAIRASDSSLVYWIIGWMVLTAACFGVVLEGPMGAVIFWCSWGIAAAIAAQPKAEEALPEDGETALPVTQ